ncbi:MAG: hypothetical protein HFE85_02975 [Clostridiales bacterium]|nr:hypothetical protein [Clostridiales bacterium]
MALDESCKRELEALCRNLTDLRKQHGLTVKELSHQTDIPEKILLQLEQGETKRFHSGYLLCLSRFYNVLPSVLMEEELDNPDVPREY